MGLWVPENVEFSDGCMFYSGIWVISGTVHNPTGLIGKAIGRAGGRLNRSRYQGCLNDDVNLFPFFSVLAFLGRLLQSMVTGLFSTRVVTLADRGPSFPVVLAKLLCHLFTCSPWVTYSKPTPKLCLVWSSWSGAVSKRQKVEQERIQHSSVHSPQKSLVAFRQPTNGAVYDTQYEISKGLKDGSNG